MTKQLTLAFLLAAMYLPAALLAQPPVDPADPAEEQAEDAAVEAAAEAPPPVSDPAVLAIQETNPTTPTELVRATNILVGLRHAEVARQYVIKLLEANLAESELAALGAEFGSAAFLRMALEEGLQPEGQQFAAAVRTALANYAADPARIAGEIARLQDPSVDVRRRAILELRGGGTASVRALIAALADPARAAEHEAIRQGLVGQGEAALGPALAMLTAPEEALQIQAIDVLGRLQMPEAMPFLLAPAVSPERAAEIRKTAEAALLRLIDAVPTPRDAALAIHREARGYYDGIRVLDRDGDGVVEVWRWDAATGEPVADVLPALQARVAVARRLAEDLVELLPDSPTARRLYLAALLETEVLRLPASEPLPTGEGTAHAVAAAYGPDAIYDLLDDAMAQGRQRAAAAAARVLGEIGSAELLFRNSPEESALVTAARSPNRRLRFAAVEAIQRLHPAREYPGAQAVLESLAFFAAASGAPRALVADGSLSDGQSVAGLLIQRGYDVDLVGDGRALLKTAAASPDYELAFVDLELPSWPLDQVLQQLRRNGRSAALPLGLMPPPRAEYAAEELVKNDERSVVVIRPTDLLSLDLALGRVLAAGSGEITAPPERQAQALRALGWLHALAAEGAGIYDVTRAEEAALGALRVPELSVPAAALLAHLGTPDAQRALVDVASTNAWPLETRQRAAEAFRDSVVRRGKLLTTGEIERQYDRYNASETLDAETQRVLGFVLDVIEAETKGIED